MATVEVAIPFSSGLCSFEDDVRGKHVIGVRRNPFFIRSVFVLSNDM